MEDMSIPLKFGLFWTGANLSYLRYLTFKSLRHFHPDAHIYLCIPERFGLGQQKWGGESQDFQNNANCEDYSELLEDLGVEVDFVEYIGDPDYCPILQSDIFRWIWMRDNGGIYLDTDQIILRNFDTLPLEKEFIYCRYDEIQCGDYCPTGVLGLSKGSPIANIAIEKIANTYRDNSYNSSGPFMMRRALGKMNLSDSFNAPWEYFYPVRGSNGVEGIYDGSFVIPKNSYALHWYGGHGRSQKFNATYNENVMKTSNDTISRTLRGYGIV